MVATDQDGKEICAKILYLGPRHAGKTTNLRSLYSLASEEVKAGTHQLAGSGDDRTFFDFIPFSAGKIQDRNLKLHIFAFDLEVPFESLRKILFTGVDGFVFVADSNLNRLLDNRESLDLAHFLFKEEGYLLSELPHVIQFNKRDEKTVIPVSVLSRELNTYYAPETEAIAIQSKGTFETLSIITRQIVDRVVPGYSYALSKDYPQDSPPQPELSP